MLLLSLIDVTGNLWPWMTLDDGMDGWTGQMMKEKSFTTTLHDHNVLYI
jgi:hypothetical protein